MRAHVVAFGVLLSAAVLGTACSSSSGREGFDDDDDDDESSSGTGSIGTGSSGSIDPGTSSSGGAPAPTDGSQVDLNTVTPCDESLAVDGDAQAFLKAIGLCKTTSESGTEWGVIDAKFVKTVGSDSANGNDEQHGILPKFGDVIEPREGKSLGALSTGYGREYDDPDSSPPPGDDDYTGAFVIGKQWTCNAFEDDDCDEENDVIDFKVKIRVPTNAHGLHFDLNFYSSEWPVYIGSEFNDHFVANLNGTNISFDANNNEVSVNNGFFDRCEPDREIGCEGESSTSVCPGGPSELGGTGFGVQGPGGCEVDHGERATVTLGGATGWLTTKATVTPGDVITLEFAIWDAHDADLDSLVLIDNFGWEADPVTTSTTRPPN